MVVFGVSGEAMGVRQRRGVRTNREREVQHRLVRRSKFSQVRPRHVLRILLFCNVPQGSAGPVTRRLLLGFNSLTNIVSTSVRDLVRIGNVARGTTALVGAVVPLTHQCGSRGFGVKRGFSDYGRVNSFLISGCVTHGGRYFTVADLSGRNELLNFSVVDRNVPSTIDISFHSITSAILEHGTSYIVVSRGRVAGGTLPDRRSVTAALDLGGSLRDVDIQLLSRMVVTNSSCVSVQRDRGCSVVFGWVVAAIIFDIGGFSGRIDLICGVYYLGFGG